MPPHRLRRPRHVLTEKEKNGKARARRPGHVDSALRPGPSGEGPWDRSVAAVGCRAGGRGTAREPAAVLSVVVPAKNEAACLPQLVDEIAGALRPLRDGGPRVRLDGFEILIVDDGSTDGTPAVLRGLAADYPELRAIVLADGVGQSSATMAGFRAARGGWIATLDADLQNDPADLVRLWEALPGHDVALGWRRIAAMTGRGGSSAGGRIGCAMPCSASRSATPGARCGSSPAQLALRLAGVPRGPPVPGPALAARGVPAGAGSGRPSSPTARPVALQPVEPVAPGGRRPRRRRLAVAPAGPVSGASGVGCRRARRCGPRRRAVGIASPVAED